MNRVEVDDKRNRLTIVLSGTIGKADAESLIGEINSALERLRPGFDVVNDMREFQLGHIAAATVLEQTIALLQQHQVGRIVRIVGDSKTALAQFTRVTEQVSDYKPVLVSSLEKAEEVLSQPRADS